MKLIIEGSEKELKYLQIKANYRGLKTDLINILIQNEIPPVETEPMETKIDLVETEQKKPIKRPHYPKPEKE